MTQDRILFLDIRSAVYSDRGTISAPIYFKIKGESFPDHNWFDFPVTLLTWWTEKLNSPSDKFDLDFMDGPFLLEVKNTGSTCELKCIRRTKSGREVLASDIIDFRLLQMEVHERAHEVLSNIQRDKADPQDVKALEKALS